MRHCRWGASLKTWSNILFTLRYHWYGQRYCLSRLCRESRTEAQHQSGRTSAMRGNCFCCRIELCKDPRVPPESPLPTGS